MPVNEKFLAARAAEQRNRLIAYLPGPEPVCGVLIRHLTPRASAELSIAGNAFAVGGVPSLGDVFQFLWRLHPAFARPHRILRGRRVWQLVAAYGLRTGLARARLASQVRRLVLADAVREIEAYLAAVNQDRPPQDVKAKNKPVSRVTPPPCWLDNFALHFSGLIPNLSPDAVIDLPLARLFQLEREHRLRQPEGELDVFDPSDALLSA